MCSFFVFCLGFFVCVLGFVFCFVVVSGCVWFGFCVVYYALIRDLIGV